jgi:hypothetical protein
MPGRIVDGKQGASVEAESGVVYRNSRDAVLEPRYRTVRGSIRSIS